MSTLLEQFLDLKKQILNWPNNPHSSSQEEIDNEFSKLEDDLRKILAESLNLSDAKEKQAFKIAIEEFYNEMKQHHENIQKELENLQNDYQDSMMYIQAVKAYTKF